MSYLKIPSFANIKKITKQFVEDLQSFTIKNDVSDTFHPVICCVCDSIPSEAKWSCFVSVTEAKKLFKKSSMEANKLIEQGYPEELVKQYSIQHNDLNNYVLSPASYINDNDEILICKRCYSVLAENMENKKKKLPPKEAIANGYIIGDAPFELKDLNEVELTLVSRARIYCQSWVFYGECHQHIQGWHTFFKNRPSDNVGNIQQLTENGMKGQLLVALCGPFTTTQRALIKKKTKVNPEKIIRAWKWLIDNNVRYSKEEIPHIDSIPKPYVFDEKLTREDSDIEIENQITMTVIFPDSSLPEPTNGGFETQDEFRKYIISQQDGKWNAELHVRPLNERLADYKDDSIADAFPLLFPYGYTGLAEDPQVVKLKIQNPKNKKHFDRTRHHVLKKYLRHRKPEFHGPMFNLITFNLIMKEIIFKTSQIFCNSKFSENASMGEKYGAMGGNQLENAIYNNRNGVSSHHGNVVPNRFLQSIRAACSNLPHSNESSMEARKTYFSFVQYFGLPSIFLTVNPDDYRNFRIVVYSLVGKKLIPGTENVKDLSDNEILEDFKIRREARFNHPGLCAEEYERIVNLVIKHLFNWDLENQKSNGMGLFAEIDAFALATEEQGRKTLHGHFLVFVKNWNQVLTVLQQKVNLSSRLSLQDAINETKAFYSNACSAQLFSDFSNDRPLEAVPVFQHDTYPCRKRKRSDLMHIIQPVSNQILREMRHKQLCHLHNGHIATCEKCDKMFSINEIISNALNVHLGNSNCTFIFPDQSIKRLDKYVYEQQKDFEWMIKDEYDQAVRYFACNALVNVHLTTHAARCFKKGSECFANLPDSSSESIEIQYNEDYDVWSDWCGNKEKRYMFRLRPKRFMEDAFINTHNPILTTLLGCNSNVMVGMNGRAVIYVTGYNAKSQQKDERTAFEKIADILIRIIENQVCLTCFR
jgi:Helitron helicase-like domain at N-terminus